MSSYQSKHTGAEIDAGIDAANAALPKSGGTMSGTLILHRNPSNNYEAATKQYVDQSISNISASTGADGKDGVGINSIAKTATSGLVDTYTITLTDNTQYTFTITNGKDGSDGSSSGSGSLYMQASGGYIQYSNDGISWENVIAISDLKGASGADGEDGADGFSPTVSIQEISGGHRVTITDATGVKTFDVMDGIDGTSISSGSTSSGDMLKSTYDTDNDGIVDNAQNARTLCGNKPADFAAANHAHAGYASVEHEHDYVKSVNGQTGNVTIEASSAPSTSEIVNLIYPVGSIYMSINSTSPSTLFGGSWTRIQDRFLLAAGSSYSAGATGGEASHVLTTSEMPSHSHGRGTMNIYGSLKVRAYDGNGSSVEAGNNVAGANAFSTTTKGSGETWGNSFAPSTTDNNPDLVDFNAADGWTGESEAIGGDAAHNNMPPYLAVYIWKRTA